MAMKYTVTISKEDRSTYRSDNGLCVAWAWACEQFGHPGIDHGTRKHRWNTDSSCKFFFRDEGDAVLFALRWGNGS
jgi:hypothetical protein